MTVKDARAGARGRFESGRGIRVATYRRDTMTAIYTFREFVEEQLPEYLADKDNPDEWYVLQGEQVTEYSIWNDVELDDDHEEMKEELPPEDRDANPNVEDHVQLGTMGWLADGFDFEENEGGFVSQIQWGNKIERNLLNLLVVHESVLSEKALKHAGGSQEAEV